VNVVAQFAATLGRIGGMLDELTHQRDQAQAELAEVQAALAASEQQAVDATLLAESVELGARLAGAHTEQARAELRLAQTALSACERQRDLLWQQRERAIARHGNNGAGYCSSCCIDGDSEGPLDLAPFPCDTYRALTERCVNLRKVRR
jgi:hypothetical protein